MNLELHFWPYDLFLDFAWRADKKVKHLTQIILFVSNYLFILAENPSKIPQIKKCHFYQ